MVKYICSACGKELRVIKKRMNAEGKLLLTFKHPPYEKSTRRNRDK